MSFLPLRALRLVMDRALYWHFLRLLFVTFAVSFLPSSLHAGEVILELKGGDLKIRGELVDSNSESYVLDAISLGRITVSRSKFACSGESCLETDAAVATNGEKLTEIVRVRGASVVGEKLFPQLIEDYSDWISASTGQTTTSSGSVFFNIGLDSGSLVGIDLRTESSSEVVQALAERKADIGLTSRRLTDSEIGTLTKAGFVPFGSLYNQFVIGVDGIAIIVSPDNPVTALSLEDISRIFAGEITDWAEFGAPQGPITLYGPQAGNDRHQAFANLVMEPYKRSFQTKATTFHSDDELAKAVSADKFGIGFVGIKNTAPANPLGVKDTCGLVHTSSNFTVLSGEYPLSRTLHLHTSNLTSNIRSDIIRFAMTANGDRAVEKAGFISKSIRTLPFDFFRARIASSVNAATKDLDIALLKQLMVDLEGGYRLSTTLRFVAASTRFEKESSDALERLVVFLKEQDLSGRKILLAGYSDPSGYDAQSRALSQRRAHAAREALLYVAEGALKSEQIMAIGYGKLFPIACNDTKAGRKRNRRVEVWLVPAKSALPSVLTKQL